MNDADQSQPTLLEDRIKDAEAIALQALPELRHILGGMMLNELNSPHITEFLRNMVLRGVALERFAPRTAEQTTEILRSGEVVIHEGD